MIGGDWNACPQDNPTYGALYLSGWHCPQPLANGHIAHCTFHGPEGPIADRLLDYWVCSPSLTCLDRQEIAPPSSVGHARVLLELPGHKLTESTYLVPCPPDFSDEKEAHTCERVDWKQVKAAITDTLPNDLEQGWQHWHQAQHDYLRDHSRTCPSHNGRPRRCHPDQRHALGASTV